MKKLVKYVVIFSFFITNKLAAQPAIHLAENMVIAVPEINKQTMKALSDFIISNGLFLNATYCAKHKVILTRINTKQMSGAGELEEIISQVVSKEKFILKDPETYDDMSRECSNNSDNRIIK